MFCDVWFPLYKHSNEVATCVCLDLVKAVRWKRVRGSVATGFRALHQHLGVRSGVSLILTLQPVIVLAMKWVHSISLGRKFYQSWYRTCEARVASAEGLAGICCHA